ncbi:MAG: Fic/DOC family protein [Tenericutes bacterium ADurb.BinA155]|nr:MAG: Fic/DOC family protein [Tenericutes bacterium ADurb.BinA155]
MSTYEPPYSLDDALFLLIASISEKMTRVDFSTAGASPLRLRKEVQLQSLHSSLAIEANSLTLDAVKDVVKGVPVLGPQKDIWEVKDALAAYDLIAKVDPFSLQDFLKVHQLMTQHTVSDAGTFRHTGEGVFSGERCVFMAPPPERVNGLMQDLFAWIKASQTKVHPLILSSVFHFELVFIHPFSDGNGRMARYWQSALLGQSNPLFYSFPVENQIREHQADYYQAIAESEKAGNSNVFLHFILTMFDLTLDRLLKGTSAHRKVTVRRAHWWTSLSHGRYYTAKELQVRLGLKSISYFRSHFLEPALKEGHLLPSDPLSPRSPTQRYRKKD